MHYFGIKAASLGVAALIAAPFGALAQTAPAPEQPMMEQQQQQQPSEEQIDAFAGATAQIMRIQQDANQKLQTAGDETEMQAIQQEAQSEMATAVQNSGLSVDEYNALAQLSQTDQGFAGRVNERLQQELGGG